MKLLYWERLPSSRNSHLSKDLADNNFPRLTARAEDPIIPFTPDMPDKCWVTKASKDQVPSLL